MVLVATLVAVMAGVAEAVTVAVGVGESTSTRTALLTVPPASLVNMAR